MTTADLGFECSEVGGCVIPSITEDQCTESIASIPSLKFSSKISSGKQDAKLELPGAAFTWSVPIADSTDGNINCVAYIKSAGALSNNILGNVFIANYVTTLDFENQRISLIANANAPEGVDVVNPTVDSGLSSGAVAGIVLGGLAGCILIIFLIVCFMRRGDKEDINQSVLDASYATDLNHDSDDEHCTEKSRDDDSPKRTSQGGQGRPLINH